MPKAIAAWPWVITLLPKAIAAWPSVRAATAALIRVSLWVAAPFPAVIVKGSRNTSVSEEGVVIGYDTTDGELLGALSIGDDGKYRQIINVADGSEAHDAVTVRQLQNAIGAVATTPTKYYHANSTAEDSLAVGEDSLAMGAKPSLMVMRVLVSA
ncbi:hypothetical protein DMI65_13550 [Escherichia coli]|nr:hypothetical protein [Escherichia coli]